ncbi:MAG: site-specific integrase, partial [Anaerolineae bacterium]|nr:site-specific integrase [Anaerolineae bacterium]
MKRSSGEGSIYRRTDGRWAASLMVHNRRYVVYAKTRREAAEKLRQLQQVAHTLGHLPDPGKLTLGDYLATWLEQAGQRLRPQTLANYRLTVEKLIVPHLGGVKLAKLNGLALTTFLAHLAKNGTSAFRLRQTYALLHKALGDAQRWGLLPNNPAATIERPHPKPAKRHIWTPGQVAAFLAAVEAGQGGRYSDLFCFLLASGCRLGEALGLRWTDVDWQAGTVKIERQITEVGSRPVEGAPKSQAGVRVIALPSWGLRALERQRARVRTWQL